MPIAYYRRTERLDNPSANLNNAIQNSSGAYIKPIFLDDRLYTTDALEEFAYAAKKTNAGWLASGSVYTSDTIIHARRKNPFLHTRNLVGVNLLGMPSVTMFKNDGLLFDEELVWLLDCEFYHRLYLRYGNPYIIRKYLVLLREWPGSVSSGTQEEMKLREEAYVMEKHIETYPIEKGKPFSQELWIKTLRAFGK